ncbi:hypothetical protein L7F22_016891 [Adiantum nelumboides]|nr:hypothetical protein [Adiantum nelumboides]
MTLINQGFISLACGSQFTSTYSDENGIEWVADTNFMQEGEALLAGQHPSKVLSSMRVFAGNASKYCYSLSNSAVQSQAFFLVRASFWAGTSPLYTPQSVDGNYRFKLLIDADEWTDLKVPYLGNTNSWRFKEMYVRAQRSSIDVCLARSSPDGDPPFISALELRPLPSTLTPAIVMDTFGFDALYLEITRSHYTTTTDYNLTREAQFACRYPFDPFDRMWSAELIEAEADRISTNRSINTTTSRNRPPERILQSAFVASPSITLSLSKIAEGRTYVAVLYFAEIDPAVTAAGQRVFNVEVNGELYNTEGPIDAMNMSGGAYDAASYTLVVRPRAGDSQLFFNISAAPSSRFAPFLAASEFFLLANVTSSALSFPDDGQFYVRFFF